MQRKRDIKILAVCLLFCQLSIICVTAQRPRYDKLSPMLRKMVRRGPTPSPSLNGGEYIVNSKGNYSPPSTGGAGGGSSVCAFVKIGEGGVGALLDNGCRVLTQVDDICIADIPIDRLGELSLDRRILRVEANRSRHTVQTDSLADYLGALPVYEGRQLPGAYTGRGVVVGVMDIGFDLTHPNFYSRDTTEYRISRFWDMLSADTVGSTLYVGRDYQGRDTLLSLGHARDGLDQYHGTHTLGIAAGSGYDTDYRGLAPESDICLVANAVSDDIALIDTADYYKYTFATDALGFKYIFDYADSVGRPCVINFSEGSRQDFWGYDLLYYEMLQKLTGPGHIIVSSAGNYGYDYTYLHKPQGQASAGAFVSAWSRSAMLTFKSDGDFLLRLVTYGAEHNDTLIIDSRDVTSAEDSLLITHFSSLTSQTEAYPSCYDPAETCYDLTLTEEHTLRRGVPISFEVIGREANVEAYVAEGYMDVNTDVNPHLADCQMSHSILSPASAPGIICVGATHYRPGIVNHAGEWQQMSTGPRGEWCLFSSVGPTFDGRMKPDVVAPGMYVVSSFSSYYEEQHPQSGDLVWDVARFQFGGRTYAWNAQCGTSMASPVVAGAIALWLQARPDLTPDDILDVFSHTCRHYDPSLTYPNNYYGYGEIDVYRGLLYLLGADAIRGVSTRQSEASIAYSRGRLTVVWPSPLAQSTPLAIYSLDGKRVFTATLPPHVSTHELQLPPLPHAVYVVQFGRSSSALVEVK